MSNPDPELSDVFAELRRIREVGVAKLQTLTLPTLTVLALSARPDGVAITPSVAIEQLVLRAIERLGGGSYGEAAMCAFGLAVGTRGLGPRERQERAADCLNISASTFRTRHQTAIVSDVANQVLALSLPSTGNVRDEPFRTSDSNPLDTAIDWVARFEAYYRLWTPIQALGSDLEAMWQSRWIEPPSDALPIGDQAEPDDADGYAQFALYHYASFQVQLRRFLDQHGGLWLFPDAKDEATVTTAIGQILQGTPLNERDQSFLRELLQAVRGEEMHGFLQALARTAIGQATYAEWIDWVVTCECPPVIAPDGESTSGEVPDDSTRANQSTCQVHQVIRACDAYCGAVDSSWSRLSDWTGT